MNTVLKTALIAAVGTAVAAASPAFAKSRRAVDTVTPAYSATYGFQPTPGVIEQAPQSPLFAAPSANSQIQNEYIKDDSMHNGNAY